MVSSNCETSGSVKRQLWPSLSRRKRSLLQEAVELVMTARRDGKAYRDRTVVYALKANSVLGETATERRDMDVGRQAKKLRETYRVDVGHQLG